jgi:hypothetical protein
VRGNLRSDFEDDFGMRRERDAVFEPSGPNSPISSWPARIASISAT